MGQRDSRIRRYRERRADAGHDFEGNSGGDQRASLFAPTSEEEGVTAFETNDLLPSSRSLNQKLVDFILWSLIAAADICVYTNRNVTIETLKA